MSGAQFLQTADQIFSARVGWIRPRWRAGARSVIGTLPVEMRLSTCRGKRGRGNAARPVTMRLRAAEPPSRGYSRDGARDKSW